jgi:hypothetical protein
MVQKTIITRDLTQCAASGVFGLYDFSLVSPVKLIPVFLTAGSLQKRTGPLHWGKTLHPAAHFPLP